MKSLEHFKGQSVALSMEQRKLHTETTTLLRTHTLGRYLTNQASIGEGGGSMRLLLGRLDDVSLFQLRGLAAISG